MGARTGGAAAEPRWVTVWGPIAKVLLAAGVPLGPNGLLTARSALLAVVQPQFAERPLWPPDQENPEPWWTTEWS